jgi:hypothetical protein
VTHRDYSALTREQVEARLNIAEDALTVFGWTASRSGEGADVIDNAMSELWLTWHRLPGVDTSPAFNRHLSEERLRELAAQRLAVRAATLARYVTTDADPEETP